MELSSVYAQMFFNRINLNYMQKKEINVDLNDVSLEVDDVAKELKCSKSTVYRLVKNHSLPMVKKGKSRILRSDLLRWVKSSPNVRY